MAETATTPAANANPTTIQPEAVTALASMSRWEALKAAGWWTPYDWAMLGLLCLTWLTAIFWKIFGEPTALNLVAILLVNISFKLVWVISLVFRASSFVLTLTADVNMLPVHSARLAVAYLQGKK